MAGTLSDGASGARPRGEGGVPSEGAVPGLDGARWIADCRVDLALDARLKALLCTCFGDRFRHQRHCFEIPLRRLLVERDGALVAQLAVHEKLLHRDGGVDTFAGIAEVCVAPARRRGGIARAMVAEAERRHAALDHAILLGAPEVYGSSGYREVDNVAWPDATHVPSGRPMVKPLAASGWPRSPARGYGPPF